MTTTGVALGTSSAAVYGRPAMNRGPSSEKRFALAAAPLRRSACSSPARVTTFTAVRSTTPMPSKDVERRLMAKYVLTDCGASGKPMPGRDHQTVSIRIGQRTENDRVQHREYGGGRADANCEGRGNARRERRRPAKLAKRK